MALSKDLALALADFWNSRVESWTTVSDTPLARRLAVNSYYIRVAPPEVLADPASLESILYLKNRKAGATRVDEEIAIDFLQLVRFGLRSPKDALIRDSVTVADALLRVDTPNGPTWHRYNGDGYGEHADGRPFDGSGRGRAWPLLTGERGHYELVAGNDPAPYLKAMAAMTGPGGMMPEQVWDSAALPERRLFPGRPTGGAMPLVWTHAEFIKLLISRHLGYPVDRPAAAWRRYGGRRPEAARAVWCFHAPNPPDKTRAVIHHRVATPGADPLGYRRLEKCRRWEHRGQRSRPAQPRNRRCRAVASEHHQFYPSMARRPALGRHGLPSRH